MVLRFFKIIYFSKGLKKWTGYVTQIHQLIAHNARMSLESKKKPIV